MKKILALKHLHKNRREIRKKTVSQKTIAGKAAIGVLTLSFFFLAGFLYVFQVSGVATKGYEIENYEKRIFELQKEKQKMMIKIADLKSMDNLKNETSRLSAVDYKDIVYITSTGGAVAME